MNLQGIINSRIGVGSALLFGQLMPPIVGLPLSRQISRFLATRKDSDLVRSVRCNQWVVRDGKLAGTELDQATREVFYNSSKSIYDLYHNLHNPRAIDRMVEFTPKFEDVYRRVKQSGRGCVIASPHVGSFDIGGLALAVRKIDFQALSYPNPGNGYQMQNYFREKYGLNITPMSIASMRAAEEKLRSGGMALTGLDRPLASSRYKPRFFNRPAALPVSYIPMAMKTGVPVFVVCCYYEAGRYYLDASEPVEMNHFQDHQEEIERNAEKVLVEAEKMIRAHADQWYMYYPVWPEVAAQIE